MTMASPNDSTAAASERFVTRSYQQEMFQASLKGNIIVAMDTGSGKTLVAILRLQHELEQGAQNKYIWFLAPTIALCQQQEVVISRQFPAVRTLLLTGNEAVEHWSTQQIWDTALRGVRIVVSTHQVLLDALTHGFVTLSRLSLIIFDEGNRIMQDFYHIQRAAGAAELPAILGLTASPIVRSSPKELELERDIYPPLVPDNNRTLRSLTKAWNNMDVRLDPQVLKLQREGNFDKAQKMISQGRTFCGERMKKLYNTALHISQELGPWAVEFFISTAIKSFDKSVATKEASSIDISLKDKEHLLTVLKPISTKITAKVENVSPKTAVLINRLKNAEPNLSGIVFVKQRATVAVLHELLSSHPDTKHLKCGTFIGASNNSARKSEIGELVDPKNQQTTLDSFRAGEYNLIITTSALEEGIDIPACHLVICHEKPPNLKSFVQRRGRARRDKAVFVIMFQEDDTASNNKNWESLEKAMVEEYQKDSRKARQAQNAEEKEETSDMQFRTPAEALLTFDNVITHLNHFCAKGYKDAFTDPLPIFVFEEKNQLVNATVTLPNTFDKAVRKAQGRQWWHTQKAAKKDAAFQAYKALYDVGLVNDNLLPHRPTKAAATIETDTDQVLVSRQIDLWQTSSRPEWHETILTIRLQDVEIVRAKLLLPTELPFSLTTDLYWIDGSVYKAELEPSAKVETSIPVDDLKTSTEIILLSIHRRLMRVNASPRILMDPLDPKRTIREWNKFTKGVVTAAERLAECQSPEDYGMLRDSSDHNKSYVPRRYLEAQSQFEVLRFTSRRDFRGLGKTDRVLHAQKTTLDVEECAMERLPYRYTLLSLFLPTIFLNLEANLIADKLRDTVLPSIEFRDRQHLVTAITTSTVNQLVNYQRLEFLGDSVLKFIASTQLFYENPSKQESFLSDLRSQTVSNSRLVDAALRVDLLQYILQTPTERDWCPPGYQDSDASGQQFAPKMLADVVEAVIGAAYQDCGLSLAAACTQVFAPEVKLPKSLAPLKYYLDNSPTSHAYEDCQRLMGYRFNHLSILIEALTHPSHTTDVKNRSYQRLEFLGDAVLDKVVADSLFENGVQRTHGDMTLIKAATVNNDFLAYLCLKYHQTKKHDVVVQSFPRNFKSISQRSEQHLWEFMRSASPDINSAKSECSDRFAKMRDEIEAGLKGPTYPWIPLAQLGAPKFFSDLIESLLGAIFVDSSGDTSACKAFLSKIGLMETLDRFITDSGVDLLHPKNRLGKVAEGKAVICFKRQDDTGWQCSYYVDGEEVASVSDCISQEEAVLTAANEAAEELLQRQSASQPKI